MKSTTKPRPVLDWEQENRSELYLIAAISSKLSTEPMNEIDCKKSSSGDLSGKIIKLLKSQNHNFITS